MANINTINIGNVVNDGLGDDLRTAFQKVNANFAALNSELTVTVTAAQGTGVSLFKEKSGANLVFKTLVSGSNIALNDTGTSVQINMDEPLGFIRFDGDSGTVNSTVHNHLTLQGTNAPGSTTSRKDIEVTISGSTVNFKTVIPVTDILTSYDFGSINGVFNNAMQVAYAASNIDFGTITLPGRLDLDCGGIF
jgi:hypothetical protein